MLRLILHEWIYLRDTGISCVAFGIHVRKYLNWEKI